ncbi:hypothetical protein F7734_24490 [Scytonema sp. UIC 10036]|uniref:hypothetical protein n=1 Tax=Scytonema sp. UIC 10036 TaxID=2304196 RepID=UPI0012DA3AD4|nr:hypothetical protein [Scytonema sp. UIC 10036]MUG95352.1 hypothetical protein [Scytonema sp. UIC 10036]
MANYREWNQALVSYFTSGLARDKRVYLSVDNDILERIGQKFNQKIENSSKADDFRRAVREKVIVEGRVNLSQLQGRNADGIPKGVAFLGAMVLAANDMADEEEISEDNYFQRFRSVLGLRTSEHGRPTGMKFGKQGEEPLWEDWNRWLMANGFMPSAHRGRGGRTTYINYPISQALLRRTDKNRLVQLFNEKQWTAQWDAMTLFADVRREAQRLPTHLKQLLTDNRERYEAVAESIHEVYQYWQAEGRPAVVRTEIRNWRRNIFAGLYRTEDPFFGDINYYPYPKQVRGWDVSSIKIQYGEREKELRYERPGWYFPLELPLSISELERGAKYPVTIQCNLDFLVLPSRDFWILIPDPDDPEIGTYATWGQPSLGTKFTLLSKKELLPDINRLRDERLIQWSGEPQTVFNDSNWVELHQCMVISLAWDGVFISNQELKDALQPSVRLSISFSGGLRVPQQNAWLEDHSPQVTIFGFYPTVKLQITRLLDNSSIFERAQSTNTPILVNFPSSGDYLVKATCGGESTERLVKIVDWSWLGAEKPQRYEITPVSSGYYICGSVIQTVSAKG